MEESVTPLSVLGPQCEAQRERIRKLFDSGATAQDTLRQLCELADDSIRKVFIELLRVRNSSGQGLCLLALGGYGRELLFPYSDLDLLFLFGGDKAEQEFRPLISEFSRTLWDLGFRVSSAGRTLDECRRIEGDNAEFHLAMLDRRFIAGDEAMLNKLDSKILSGSEKTDSLFFINRIAATYPRTPRALRQYDFSLGTKREGSSRRVARLSCAAVDAPACRRAPRSSHQPG